MGYVPKTTITAYAEWERCCCVNYKLNLLATANPDVACSVRPQLCNMHIAGTCSIKF